MTEQQRLFICTRDGTLIRVRETGRRWVSEPILSGAGVQCVAVCGDQVLVGTRGRGLLLSHNAGVDWDPVELPQPDVFSVAISAADGALYAGTEPSHIYVSRDGAAWTELDALQAIPSRKQWSFPPRPWTHHVSWIAPDPHDAQRLLVGIELGGLMYSHDAGQTFTDHRPGAQPDVHCLAWHPLVADRAYEAAGRGAAWSQDGGSGWESADTGRDLHYCWALAVDPADPDRWYVSAASGPQAAHSGPDARGHLYRWSDGAWERLPLPDQTMPYALAATDGRLLAALADGRLLASADQRDSWQPTGIHTSPVLAMTAG